MDEKTVLILKGQSVIMEMLLSIMPNYLQESWLDTVNEHNQEVVMSFSKAGLEFKAPRTKDEPIK